MEISFRDADDLDRVLYTHSVAPHKPAVMCSATPSSLMYVDDSQFPGSKLQVHCLDMSESQPKPAARKGVVHLEQECVFDMCCVQVDENPFLFVAQNVNGIYAYNTQRDLFVGVLNGKPPGMEENIIAHGITTDGRGNLYVADGGNRCIQVFSASNGRHIGYVKDMETIGCPDKIRWCENTSSLIVSSWFEDMRWRLTVLDAPVFD